MPSLTFTDATDLVAWSDRRDAQERLPELVRRLVHASPGSPSRVSFRSGEGVQLGGWDGIVEGAGGDAFVPGGESCWELGAGSDPKGKADDDYEKRTKDPEGVDPKTTTFIFVTSRRWSNARQWANTRRAEGVWKDVRAYDADDLASWLDGAPAVHAWISSVIGKHPDGAEDMETWWRAWSDVTFPPTGAALVLAGRAESAKAVRGWLNGPASVGAIRADTVDEAVAFLASVMRETADGDSARWLARTLIVTDPAAWATLVRSTHPLVLVPTFADRARAPSAAAQGHHVVMVAGKSEPELPGAVTLPLHRKKDARAALSQMGVAEDRLDELAALARGGMGAVRRAIARNPTALIPDWASTDNRRLLLPALLAGRWSDASEADREAIASLASRPYDEYREILVRMATTSDPPLRLIGTMWTVCARSDAWALLAQFLTAVELARFETTALKVLGEPDPKFDLPSGDRWMAAVHGKVARHSEFLKDGLGETLAIMAGLSDVFPLAGNQTGQQWATRTVRSLLDPATTWQAWASIGGRLRLLAEAAPDTFLDLVDRELAASDASIAGLFTSDGGGPFASRPYTELLWALEVVAWSPEHLGRASLLLSKLAAFDRGGNTANGPSHSLHEIFLTWRPHTSASPAQRLRVLDMLRQREPAAAWNLMASFLGRGTSYSLGTARPRYRDWATDPTVTHLDVYNASAAILQRLREDVGTLAERWTTLIALLDDVPEAESDSILVELSNLDPAKLPAAGRTSIRDAMRELISRHRSYPDTDWALSSERIDKIEDAYRHFDPADVIERHTWLFGDNPQLLEGDVRNWKDREAKLRAHQIGAVGDVWAAGGPDAVCRLAEHVRRPFVVGVALGRSLLAAEVEDELLARTLASPNSARRELGSGYLRGRDMQSGSSWLNDLRTRSAWNTWSTAQRADYFLILPFDPATWDLVSTGGEDLVRAYWTQAGTFGRGDVPATDRDRAVREFLRHDRHAAAVQFLALYRDKEPRPSADLAFGALEGLIGASEMAAGELHAAAHDIGSLLDIVDHVPSPDEARIARLEWLFFPVLEHTRPARVLQEAIASDPAFFIELISLIYKPHNGPTQGSATDEQRLRAQLAHRLLHEWRRPPGLSRDGAIDPAALSEWTTRARALAAAADRSIVADLQIGDVLTHYPPGSDGAWPHEAVRDLIESVGSEHLESGLRTGIYNNRGVTTREVGEGGRQERDLVANYREHAAALVDQWPRTARLLREIAETYQSEAGREDLQAELEEELLR